MICPINKKFPREVKSIITIIIDTSNERLCNKQIRKVQALRNNSDVSLSIIFKNLENDK